MDEARAMKIPEMVIGSPSGFRSMPAIGMGTAVDRRHSDSSAIKRAILEAIGVGYRHFDAAALYASEPYLGEAIAEALKLGLVGSRDELFITSKLWCTDAHTHLVIPALKNSLLYDRFLNYLNLK